MPKLHTSPCPACRIRSRGNQAFCGSCTAKVKVCLTDDERWLCERLPSILRRALVKEGWNLALYEVAADKLARGLQPNLDERLAAGSLVWLLGLHLDSLRVQDKDLEMLYRKLMLHDRRTLQTAPYPLLSESI